jgi:starch synthase
MASSSQAVSLVFLLPPPLAAAIAPNGFSFEGTDTAGLDYALNRALSMWYSDKQGWYELAASVMQQDWSWDGPALDYLELYYKALKGNN